MQSWLAVPIVRRGVGIGLVEIDATSSNAFGHDDVALLETVVRVLSGPVELAAHHEEEVRTTELRDAFIGVISHELRTPITTIYGVAKILRQRGASLDERARPDDRGHRGGGRPAHPPGRGPARPVPRRARPLEVDGEPIGIGPLVRRRSPRSTRHAGRPVRRRGRRRAAAGDRRGDVRRAGRPQPAYERGEVREDDRPIGSRSVAARRREVCVRVLDEGIGIVGADAARAFELFFRSKSATRMASGAGIGLFVCRQLVEAMGGRIWAMPRETVGTEVGFSACRSTTTTTTRAGRYRLAVRRSRRLLGPAASATPFRFIRTNRALTARIRGPIPCLGRNSFVPERDPWVWSYARLGTTPVAPIPAESFGKSRVFSSSGWSLLNRRRGACESQSFPVPTHESRGLGPPRHAVVIVSSHDPARVAA